MLKSVKLTDRVSLTQKVVNQIKEGLISGDLKPGDKLPPENVLVDKFSVSRTAIREAIKMLSAIGAVKIKQGSGTFIARDLSTRTLNSLAFTLVLNRKTPQELLELREMLEIGIIGRVIEKATSEDIKKMERAIENLESKVDVENAEELCQADLHFHYVFAEAAHNSLIEKIARTMWEMFAPSIRRCMKNRQIKVEESVREHKMILKAVKERNMVEGIEAIHACLRAWKEDKYGSVDESSKGAKGDKGFKKSMANARAKS